ncbi:protein transport protein Sec31B isoform X1 [Cuculus canorus]|uniref:protein transport protein Sec31B isoform X1 n=1 Tax=Cuculus canorus TaxID=55661 RepID=UPI0023AA672F|nr:protein transport protein Sec31B isoform X1 [Cuculus canorus]XP_053926950.1 protein transport protein Sec31B isoform X1 [Cuculus canorus]XP_053926951.1 protein transport protein Sec31B isoform X1 [Cuculus canorus]XP_053926952.1 protein transport protein Sec31B isoform X1 [Cuculus canorus]XP_053926953.1 protein transport protein Sec31B isoform X1 [Cuculus canorus]
MKLKEIERTAVQAWSPANNHPIYLATGTSAQQLDASFSTNATLEIFEADFRDPSLDMKQKGTLPASNRFHKLIWGNFGNESPESHGVIIGGGDNGVLTMYSVHRILASKSEPVIGQTEKHSGPVRALDFNPFQSNLLASGANDSEIFIWDLNNFSVPMTPGSKSQPHEDVSVVSWNRQVQHILSSAHPSGKAVVWDLRKNEPIIKVSDHSNRMHCSGMAWHPEVATQLVLSSEDDRLPVIQIWDLRFATSPLSQLEGHTRGVLSVSWCQADPELLLSSAKDNRILCWNPSMGEVVYELPIRSQWCFDVQWCPRNPSVFSAATFDGWINIYSVMGGNLEAQQKTQADKISSSFNNLDPFGTGQILPPLQVPEQIAQTTLIPPLKKPPKWIRRPVGVSFAFGGKLITFGLTKAPGQLTQQSHPHQVFISQVTTETEFLLRSRELQMALQSGNLLDYCQGKIQTAKSPFDENLWNFLKVNLEQEPRTKLLRLLGYSKENLQEKITSCLSNGITDKQPVPEADETNTAQPDELLVNSSDDVAASSSSAFFDNLIPQNMSTLEIPVTEDTDGLISQALLLGNFEGAVDLCMRAERFADAIILAIAGGENLLKETQKHYFAKQKTKLSLLLSSIVQQNWQDIVCTCDLQSWRETLAILLTYSKHEDYTQLCDMLGARLESDGDAALSGNACLCYISSGNVERLVECWVKNHETSSPLALQDLIEKVMVLSRSIEMLRGTAGPVPGPVWAEQITQYASLLASQGCLAAAMNYLPSSSKELLIEQLRDRLFHAQGENVGDQQPPPFPYTRVNVGVIKHTSPAVKGGSTPEGAAHKTGPRHPEKLQPSYQSFASSAPSQPSVPSLFTPQPVPAMSMTPHHIAPPQAGTSTQTVYSRGPPYPQHNLGLVPATASGPVVPQSQPFGPAGVRPIGPPPFPSQPSLPGQSMPMTSPGVPPPGSVLFSPAPVPSTQLPAACPLPVESQPPVGFSSAPFNCPMNMGYPQGGPGAPSTKPLPAASIPPPPPTGFFPWLDPHVDHAAQESWTDTSAVRGGLPKKKLPEKFTPPPPITAPVMSVPTEPQGIHPQLSRLQESGQSPPGAPKEGNLQYHQLPVERVERKELPPEHQALKATFEGLVQRCSAVATDPKTRRKLEDALQRLECLYEKLREQVLSPAIIMGLHEIARCIEARNYQQGLLVHTQVVSSSSFSEVSGFMPILKVLMTIAGKLNV